MHAITSSLITLSFVLAGAAPAFSGNGDIVKELSGAASWEFGQVMEGYEAQSLAPTKRVEKVWQQKALMRLSASADVHKRLRITLGAEGMMTYSWYKQQEKFDEAKMLPRFYFDRADVFGVVFGELDRPILGVGAGYFPFKYNPDVRNLGEYLFRTGTYPQYIVNTFDYPRSRLLGLRLQSELFDILRFDAMLISETDMVPLADFGVSVLGRARIARGFVEIGGGVFFSHLISVNEEYTSPVFPSNLIPDTVAPFDTAYYTFKAGKLMGRISIDPKAFFPNMRFFGPNDLRLYGEVAVLGWKDYPRYYDERWRRIPIMAGFNVPAFRILDVAAIEVEYFRGKYPNSYEEVYMRQNLPLPTTMGMTNVDVDYDKDDSFKWSIYLSKTILNSLTLTAQFANDHMRLVKHDDREMDKEEALRQPGDWWWVVKVGYGF